MTQDAKKFYILLSALFGVLSILVVVAPAVAGTINPGQPGSPILATIPIPSIQPDANASASDVQINVKTNRVYVSNTLSVTVLDGATDTIIANIPVPAAAVPNLYGNVGIYQSCVDDVTNTVYSLSENGVVTAIDGATNTVKSTFSPLPTSTISNVDGIACNPDTGKLYMVLWNPGSKIVVWDTNKQETAAILDVTDHEEWLAVNRKTNRIYAQTDFQGVVVIDGATDTVIDRIKAGQIPKPLGCQSQSKPNCVNPGSWLEQIAVDEESNRIYVGGIQDGSLITIDGATNKVISTHYYDYFPYSVAVDPVRHSIYSLDVTFDLLTEIDGRTGKRKRNISVGPGPFPLECALGFVQINPNAACIASNNGTVGGLQGVAANPNNGKIYMTYFGAYNFVAGVPNAYSYLIVVAPSESAAAGVSADSAPNAADTAIAVNTSSSVNTQKASLAGTVTLPEGAGAVDAVINSKHNTLYIANSGAHSVSEFSIGSQSVTETISVGASPVAIAGSESANTLYTFNADGSVSVLNSVSHKLVANFPVDTTASGLLGLNPRDIVHSQRTGKLYAINGFNQIDVIDPVTRKVTVIPDADASNVAINQATNTLYVSQYSSGAVWVIDGTSDSVTSIIENVGLPAQPAGCYQGVGGPNACLQMSSGLTQIAVDEILNRVYVLGQYDGSVVTIDGKTNQVIGVQFINSGAYGLAVNPLTHMVYADNFVTPALWAIDGRTGQIRDVVNFNSLFCDTANTSCYDQTDLKSVTVNPATGSVYTLDQGDLNPNKTSQIYIVNSSSGP